ncbi:MAG: hypothetical protein LBG67_00660 [Campylobacteraceae bacterium]|jgi:hypothetical protein|nr:hypothetical protein [Campylobacteraceae bacterium]
MKIFKIIFLAMSLLIINGCSAPEPYIPQQSYAKFAENLNLTIGGSHIPERNQARREVYSEDKYIYKFETPPKCSFGYLTNRDDKPEKVIGWVVLSSKEFCRRQIR